MSPLFPEIACLETGKHTVTAMSMIEGLVFMTLTEC